MTLNEMIADVRSRLDESTAGFWTDAEITVWLNEANVRVAVELEDLEGTATSNIVASTANYDLPADFVRLDQAIYNGVYLKTITRDQLKQYGGLGNPTTSQTGTPEYCYIRAGDLWLYPAPSANVTNGLVLWYSKRPAALSASVECEHDPMFHYLLPLYACYIGYQKDMSAREAQTCKGMFEEGVARSREFLSDEDRIELRQIYDPGD
jgi:hypothetical protein